MALFVYPPVSLSISGSATEAKQDVIITELQDIEADVEAGNALLTTIDADTSSIATDSSSIAADASSIAADTSSIDSTLVGIALSASNTDTNTTRLSTVDFLDSGLLDSSVTNIPTAGVQVVASLASEVHEIEIADDIGEFMALTDGADVVLTYLPLGGGRIKINIPSTTTLKLASLTGGTISTGSIAINFLG